MNPSVIRGKAQCWFARILLYDDVVGRCRGTVAVVQMRVQPVAMRPSSARLAQLTRFMAPRFTRLPSTTRSQSSPTHMALSTSVSTMSKMLRNSEVEASDGWLSSWQARMDEVDSESDSESVMSGSGSGTTARLDGAGAGAGARFDGAGAGARLDGAG